MIANEKLIIDRSSLDYDLNLWVAGLIQKEKKGH
jgi:hypothetical protein